MRNIVLSVIVPIYNGEKYLDRLIEAFLMQKLDQFEVILIDDGSVDGTYQICKNYSKTYSWIRVLHTENKGVSHARNLGIKEAKGKWIHFIDVDDVIHPELFREFYEISNSEETEIIICGCIREEIETGKKVYCGPEKDQMIKKENVGKFFNNMKMEQRYWSLDYIWNKWYRREIIVKNQLAFCENLSLGEDFVFNTNYFKYISSIVLLAKPYYHYQINGSGLVSKFQPTPWIGSGKLYEAHSSLYKAIGLWESNYKEIEYQAGQIAFGDIRMLNSPKCGFNRYEKKSFIQNMIKSNQFSFMLDYLKSHHSIAYTVYYYVFMSRRTEMILMLITLEKYLNKWKRK